MTPQDQPRAGEAELREVIARIVDPSSWAVMDGYLADMKRQYHGENIGYDPDQFKHKSSLKIADDILAALSVSTTQAAQLREAEPEPNVTCLACKGTGCDGSPTAYEVRRCENCKGCGKVLSAYPRGDAGAWRPIESAPKSLKRIIAAIWHGDRYAVVIGKRIGEGFHDERDGSCVGWRPGHKRPAYWTPLPAPPSQDSGGEG